MPGMTDKDYYAILGVDKSATTDEIRKAFQAKARTLHPDVNKEPDAEERFKQVSEAYAVLSDDAKRSRYDAMRAGNPYAGYNTPAGGSQGGYGSDPFGSWGWPFSDMGAWTTSSRSTVRSRSYNPREGSNVKLDLELDPATAASGTRHGFSYQRYVSCDACNGSGSHEATHATTCPTCGGTGRMSLDLSSMFGFGVFEMDCPECEGTGKVVANPCEKCGGAGRVVSASEIVVDIPAGSHDGDEVTVAGMGNAGTNGQSAGSFVCRVGVASERLSTRAANGFRSIGFALPIILVAVFTGWVSFISMVMGFLLIYGCIQAFSDGLSHPARWWKHGFQALSQGFSSGLMPAMLLLMMSSCAAGFASRVYGR